MDTKKLKNNLTNAVFLELSTASEKSGVEKNQTDLGGPYCK